MAGTLPQDKLDKIPEVMPLRNQELANLVGQTCVAVVYDSDISMNYLPINANLQGARLGLFYFTVLAVEVPGSIVESQSSTSLYDLWLKVEPASSDPFQNYQVTVRDHEPDSIQITKAVYSNKNDRLKVFATSDFAPPLNSAVMTVSVDGADAGADPNEDPFLLEASMTFNPAKERYEFILENAGQNLDGRRITISTDAGGAYNAFIQ